MRNLTGPRILAMTLMAFAALALAGCGNGSKRRTVTTTVTTTTPARVAAPVAGVAAVTAGGGVAGTTGADVAGAADADVAGAADAGAGAKRGGGAAAAPAGPAINPNMHTTGNKLIAAAIGFGVLADGVVQSTAAGAGLAAADGQQCRNPFGTQAAGTGQLICSAGQERLSCQCDANGCQLVPTGIMACLPVGAVYQ